MSADSPVGTTVTHGGFTLSGTGADDALKAIQADEKAKSKGEEPEKPKGKAAISAAASELGKQGGKAAAKARAAAAEKVEAEPANTDEKPEKVKAAPVEEEDDEEDTADLDKHPRAKARVEEATRKAKAAREDYQREKDRADRAERERDEARRTAPRAPEPPQERRAEPEAPSDEPKLEAYLQKHGQGSEAKAISEWVGDRDKWRDGQAEEKKQIKAYAERVGKIESDLQTSLRAAKDADEGWFPKVQPIAAEIRASHTLDPKERPAAVNWLADELHLDPKNAPQILSYLADNRDDYDTLKRYHSPREVTRAVAIIVAHLEDATAGNPSSDERRVSKPESSKAPPPVRPVTGAPSTASGADPIPREGESFDAWNRRTAGKRAATR